ncbi:4-oxalocrotonate tautomerase family protein [Streptomyces sp. NPDC051954]|uniref:4-oxalocrotonate tautomerase family protein n=1 Tax=Streptomyces sp. NPDC051954 TaxID=3155524 RepID=UPI0034320347
MPHATSKVPAGTLTEKQKEQIITRTTDLYAELYGERARDTTLVLVEEVPDGGWGIGGHVLTVAEIGRTPAT